MARLTIFILLALLATNKSSGQNKETAIKLFKETSPLFIQIEKLKSTNDDSAKLLNKQLIKNLEIIFLTDSTFRHIPNYLGRSYEYANDYTKAIYWFSKQLPEYSHEEFPLACYSCIGLAYFNLGELDSCKVYILRANISFEKNYLGGQRDYLISLKKLADEVYNKSNTRIIKTLKSKGILPCKYSNDILRFILPFAEEKREYFPKFNKNTILIREKNCR